MASQSIVGTVTEDGVWASPHRTSCSGRNRSASAVWGPQCREKEREKGHNIDELTTHKNYKTYYGSLLI